MHPSHGSERSFRAGVIQIADNISKRMSGAQFNRNVSTFSKAQKGRQIGDQRLQTFPNPSKV